MKMTVNDINQIRKHITEIFNSAQVTAAVHQKNSVLLKRLYETSDGELFTTEFKKILVPILTTDGGTTFIEKTMNFVASFCSVLKPNQPDCNETDNYIEHPFVFEIISYLLETSELENDIVRFRSCQLINKILDHLVGSDVSNLLCDKLEESLLKRIHDPKNIVRQQAVLALHRLQDPTNAQDVIIMELIGLMNHDTLAKVRLLCIENIALRADVTNHIIKRIRDVDVNVRLAAYKRLTNFAKYLKISQKRHILHCGFLDTSDKVVDFMTTHLIPNWLDHYQDNVLLLMKSVRLDANESDIEETLILFGHILRTIFKTKPLRELTQLLNLDDTKLIPAECLNWETACYWRLYVQFLSKREEFEDELDKVVPELVFFCRYVKEYYSKKETGTATVDFLEKQFILKQLFLIIKTYDFADIINRQCLNSLVCNILEKVDLMSDVIEVIIKSLENSIPNVNSRSQFVSEVISEIMFPMDPEKSQEREREKEFQLSKVMVEINCLLEKQNTAVKEENFMEAERFKRELIEVNAAYKELKNSQDVPQQVQKRTDIPTIIKYLDVAASLLLSPQITELNSTLRALKNDVIQELLIHDNDNVRAKALRCYALCCIVDKDSASNGIHIFSTPIFAYQSGEECDTQTLIVCIGATVDLLRIYGAQLIAAPDDNVPSESMEEAHERVFAGGTSLTDLIQGLVDLMDDEQYEIQEKAVWGLCQLILSDTIHSSSLISRLVLKWCSPASDGENDDAQKLTQIIGFTLQRVPMTATIDQLEQAVLMTLKVLAYAPKISPLADVNIDNIANFMIALCKTSPKYTQIQANLALKICFEIKDNPKTKFNVTLSKMLLLLDISDKLIIRDLLKICDEIRDNIRERLVLTNIVKFTASLNKKNLDCSTVEDGSDENQNTADMSEAV
ncbi:condensin complex subunit 3-like [Anoplophora glabripennis]|uniref:condensin complex subunit 3-like n=1 Tax=Anoplophora glabripennis TaxID=217634 RepID=UPI0008745EE6|nr:condensin complex subunit 3-like [Anoplophora glabripennis]XP_018564706.1 condensin complex subunit 3-like [Anoplophora glabripennis]